MQILAQKYNNTVHSTIQLRPKKPSFKKIEIKIIENLRATKECKSKNSFEQQTEKKCFSKGNTTNWSH